jgi:hypothetical protein
MRNVIKADKIRIGDQLEIAYTVGDMKKVIYATVARRDRSLGYTEYITKRGYIFLTVYKSGESNPANPTITLLSHVDMAEQPLPGMDELIKELSNA